MIGRNIYKRTGLRIIIEPHYSFIEERESVKCHHIEQYYSFIEVRESVKSYLFFFRISILSVNIYYIML